MLRDISLHIIELARNSKKAGATLVHISVICGRFMLSIIVRDNGAGMSEELISSAGDPFMNVHECEKPCFGLAFFKFACEQSGGSFCIESEPGMGTTVTGEFEILNIDRPPLGDIGECFKLLKAEAPEIRLVLNIESRNGCFTADTEACNEPHIETEMSQRHIKDEINKNVHIIFGGVLNEIVS